MAVYTVLAQRDFEALAATLGLGAISDWRAVAAGIENTTYFFSCRDGSGSQQQYVLTIAEAASAAEVDFIARWMAQLAATGLPVPAPRRTAAGAAVLTLHDKSAIVVPKIDGEHLLTPTPMHCVELGRTLGRMHVIALRCGLQHTGPRNLDWLATTARRLLPLLTPADHALLTEELARLDRLRGAGLPVGIVHGDLFRDNVLFHLEAPSRTATLMAVIDFFMAGSAPLAFDLAIAVNDWCSASDGALDAARAEALLNAYESERPLTPTERQHWPELLCLAATRFWVSRLQAALQPRALHSGATPGSKDPQELRQLLLQRRRNTPNGNSR